MQPIKSLSKISVDYFNKIRLQSQFICEPLETEDYVAQPMVDVSPPRWHLAHTTWFFENFILLPHFKNYKPFHPKYHYLFNSYYVQAGERWQRAERGYLTRPTVEEILKYRKYVDEHMSNLLSTKDSEELQKLTQLGLQHEQQHQELLLYDIKYILGNNPLFPVYRNCKSEHEKSLDISETWSYIPSGTYQIGYRGEGFHFDNEEGFHTVFLHDFEVCNRLVTKGEFLEFIEDGGYENTVLWLDEGAKWVVENEIKAPMYWIRDDRGWMEFTLNGLESILSGDPLVHISFFEADAFARWKGLRLPTEQEWEIAAGRCSVTNLQNSNFMEDAHFKTLSTGTKDFFGNVWEWTASAYRPYPFYQPPNGALGEYNGKFMVNQMVLRGGSFGTSRDHIRLTYRNFFHPHLRWHFAGMRLARDI